MKRAAWVLVVVMVGCSRAGEGEGDPATATPTAPAPAPAPTPTPAPAPTPTPTPAPTPAPTPTPTPAPPAPKPPTACGDKPLPPCPLYAWMKANTSPAMASSDFDALQAALTKVAALAPPGGGYPNWVSIAKDGADAARVQNLDAVKAACRGCHNQYRAKYKHEMRDRPI